MFIFFFFFCLQNKIKLQQQANERIEYKFINFNITSLMNQLLRSSRNSVIRILSITTAGSAFLYANSYHDSKTRKTLSISAPLLWQLQQGLVDNLHFGHLPLSSFRVDPVPFTGVKEAPVEDGSDSKPCCGCIGRYTISSVAARVGPAVVSLSVHDCFHGITSGRRLGTGTIIDADGTILTCAHVLFNDQEMRGSSERKVDVTLQDGRIFEGTVVNVDLHSDIAIVKIKSTTPLPTAKLGSSAKLLPGDIVVSMGCPRSLQNTVTAGIVSCVDRESSDLGLGGMRREYLQTDCAINKGNSGGPLVNIDGEVVGVSTMSRKDSEGLHFAVPIDSVCKILEQFNKSGRVVRPWLGLKMLDLNELIIAQLQETDATFPDVNRGVLVPMVTPGSPAARAGFCSGDVVLEFDGKPIASIKEIIEIMGDRIGVPLKVVVKRANDVSITLTVIPEEITPQT
ncbi:PDZ_2 domain-containing protein/Trypsin_2 domain-containing protein [Cephalotus follicularis]|uniref:PDZ_2 domain-containing protein/Trypsin_2 domain-containing protein n=1 Tax=Cephalotus follicularis TaxID=3775 RepID=A0A1Q3D3A0_CEPFO|nr:PDZ_2 domain-containing protein/Trypsin_2 domain-containing protein [Cephalotus follicularis]